MNSKFSVCHTLKDIFSSQTCIACHDILRLTQGHSYQLCHLCLSTIIPIVPLMEAYGKKKYTVYALGAFDGVLKNLLYSKYSKDPVKFWFLGKECAQLIDSYSILCDFLVPVPLNFFKHAIRSFNQAYELAEQISLISQIPILEVLGRKYSPIAQIDTQSLEERQSNIVDAFFALETIKQIQGKSVVLVDDIYTTGATARECIKVLLRYKPLCINVLVVCRSV